MFDHSYLGYLLGQLRQTFAKRHKDASFRLRPFIQQIIATTALPYEAPILCVGVRNAVERAIWREHGYPNVMAIDLLPSRGVRAMDFHALDFPDKTFYLLMASHAYEHSWDPRQALAEAVRVLLPYGYLFAAFPVGFVPTAHDRVDFQTAQGFLAHLPDRGKARLLWQQRKPGEVALLATIYP